jgi:acetate kinase
MADWLLVLNVGSSSVKFAAFPALPGPELLRGAVTLVDGDVQLSMREGATATKTIARIKAENDPRNSAEHAFEAAVSVLGASGLAGVGHRIVHGGADFAEPVRLNAEIVAQLRRFEPLAPLHQSFSLAAIDLISRRAPGAPQVGCFDTAFHLDQPRLNVVLPIPRELTERGLRRYGFHGLSYQHVAAELRRRYGADCGRVVAAHLGAGASLCALRDGRSLATTMGMTPLGGVAMATRSGDLDPGVVLYLLEESGMSARDVRDLLYHRSGLSGISGESGDMQKLLASTRPEAAEAVAYFIERAQREIASLAGALGGLDTLVFTGGIGEHAKTIRSRICAACAWMGISLDEALNAGDAAEIQTPQSGVRIAIVCADEEAVIASAMRGVLSLG